MGRPARINVGGIVYHALNRANARMPIFENAGDYAAFLRVMAETQEIVPMRVLEYALMPNHWHLVLWPGADGQLSKFMQQMTNTHAKRWAAAHEATGLGHLYQGRFKSFPVQDDHHYLTVCRYVVRNPLRAKLAPLAEEWVWSSLYQKSHPEAAEDRPSLSAGPVDLPHTWMNIVNEPLPEGDLTTLRQCVRRGRPFGGPDWVVHTARRLNIESTLRGRGRPGKR